MVKPFQTYRTVGITAFISEEDAKEILKSPGLMKEFSEEVENFYEYFWGNEFETWQGIPEITVEGFFEDSRFLYNLVF